MEGLARVRLDDLTTAQLEAYRDAINLYITTGLFPGGVHSYQIEGRKLSRESLRDALQAQADVMAALGRKSAPDDGLGVALVEFGEPR